MRASGDKSHNTLLKYKVGNRVKCYAMKLYTEIVQKLK